MLGNKENSKREYMDPPEKGKQTRSPEKIRRLRRRKSPLVILDCVILRTKLSWPGNGSIFKTFTAH